MPAEPAPGWRTETAFIRGRMPGHRFSRVPVMRTVVRVANGAGYAYGDSCRKTRSIADDNHPARDRSIDSKRNTNPFYAARRFA